MQEVEKLPADIRLTNAINLLSKAKEFISDFVDNKESEPDNSNQKSETQDKIIKLQEIMISNLEKANEELKKAI